MEKIGLIFRFEPAKNKLNKLQIELENSKAQTRKSKRKTKIYIFLGVSILH